MRRLVQGVLIGLGLVVVLVCACAVWLIGPYVADDWKLDRAVRAAALDGRDFGIDEARRRLQFELDRGGIGMHVQDSDCAVAVGDEVRVSCRWSVDIQVPGTGLRIPIDFASNYVVDSVPPASIRAAGTQP